MPPPHPPGFRRRAIELARERAKPIAQIPADIGISESCLRTWVSQAEADDGRKEGPTTTCSIEAKTGAHARSDSTTTAS